MRRTPPVVVQWQPQRRVQGVAAGIAVLAAGGLAAWAVSHRDSFWSAWLAIPVAVAVACASRAAAVLPRRLRWDGQAWGLAKPGRDDEAAVQRGMLIDLDAWLLLARRQQGAHWGAHWGALWAPLFSVPAAVQR